MLVLSGGGLRVLLCLGFVCVGCWLAWGGPLVAVGGTWMGEGSTLTWGGSEGRVEGEEEVSVRSEGVESGG